MKVELSANLLGFYVGGYNHKEYVELDISEDYLNSMNDKDKNEYILKNVYNYIVETLEFDYEIL